MSDISLNGITYPASRKVAFPGANGQEVIFELPTEPEAFLNAVSTRPPQTKAVFNAIAAEASARSQQVAALQGAVGSPLKAATAAGMTDTSKIYVYTGSESGYTAGNWYYHNGSAWVSGGTYNSAALETDESLSVSGMAADAKVTGALLTNLADGAQDVFLKSAYRTDGYYDTSRMNNGSTIGSTGGTASSTGRVRTNILNGLYKADAVGLPDPSYCFELVGYAEANTIPANYISRSGFISGGNNNVLYRRTDWPYFAVVIARNPITDTTAFTDEEVEYLAGILTRYVYSDSANRLTAAEQALADRTSYPIDPDTYLHSFGGLKSSGASTAEKTRLRIRTTAGAGSINVLAGSKITPAAGYKFAVALYSAYSNYNDFTLREFYSMRTTALTIPYDGLIRITLAKTDDAELWDYDSDGRCVLNAAGETALTSALTLELYGGSIKAELETLKQSREEIRSPVREIDSIPLNAAAYHALWDEYVDAGLIDRTLLTNVNSDSSLPIYMYRIRSDMGHIAADYSVVPWDGSNEIYTRPKIFISSGIHGDERTTPMAVYELVRSLMTDSGFQRMRNAFDWYIVPLGNPWGFSHSMSNSTAVPNSASLHRGIRRNQDGIDINRDFAAFDTQEAQALRSAALAATADGRNVVLAVDAHQAAQGSYVNVIGAFLSLGASAASAAKDLIYGKWMQAAAVTEKVIAEYVDTEPRQSIYPWTGGGTANTMRKYMQDRADYSVCFEGGQTCIYYSGSSDWSNPVARALINTQMHNFFEAVTEIWM